MSHVYLLHKIPGETSFQAIRKLQKACGLKKVGHCGTLDKFAEGLLIVLSDSATKLAGAITGLDKGYIAEIEFGHETDTLDPEGRLVREAAVPQEGLIYSTLENWLEEIQAQGGELWQQPPAFSALHSNGKRLYQRALSGEDLTDIPLRKVKLYSCKILDWQAPFLKVELYCSKGFYVRSFARDLALRCGSAGYLRSLTRTSVGCISLEEAQTLA
ncbi:MAG: tRNA pseudouridine(55) synthase TruB [Spirochaetota bacterium]